MNAKDLRPARDFALNFGCKALVYGPPGSSKTPTINTCPRPVMLACEPGMLSMRGSSVPTFQAFTAKLLNEFFDWLFGSAEVKNFDTIAIDSTSQMAEIYLAEAKKNNKHGLQAYGEMAVNTLKQLDTLYYMQHKHTYLICKEAAVDDNGIRIRKPYFPGQQLPVEVPHKYDVVTRLAIHNVPGIGAVKAFRCIGSIEETARNRTGTLAEFEEPEFSKLVAKVMS